MYPSNGIFLRVEKLLRTVPLYDTHGYSERALQASQSTRLKVELVSPLYLRTRSRFSCVRKVFFRFQKSHYLTPLSFSSSGNKPFISQFYNVGSLRGRPNWVKIILQYIIVCISIYSGTKYVKEFICNISLSIIYSKLVCV